MKSESILNKISYTSALRNRPQAAEVRTLRPSVSRNPAGKPMRLERPRPLATPRPMRPPLKRRPALLAAVRAFFASGQWLRREDIYAALDVPDVVDAKTVDNLLGRLVWERELIARETGETYLLGRSRKEFSKNPRPRSERGLGRR